MQSEKITVSARDGFALAATVYRPETQSRARAAIILNSATAVRRRFYDSYARHLCGRGFVVLTYDYRGVGDSIHGAAVRLARMQDWGESDFAGALDWLGAACPGLPLLCVGHSVGGQLVGLADNAQRLSGLLGIAAQSGYWRHWRKRHWPRLLFTWFCMVPVTATLLGKVPGALAGGQPLPGRIALQWARWCRNPAYISDARGRRWRPHFAAVTCPSAFYAISDDDAIAPLPAVEALAGFYASAQPRTIRVIDASTFGGAIGHFGYFKRGAPKALWNETADWLVARADAAGRQAVAGATDDSMQAMPGSATRR